MMMQWHLIKIISKIIRFAIDNIDIEKTRRSFLDYNNSASYKCQQTFVLEYLNWYNRLVRLYIKRVVRLRTGSYQKRKRGKKK